MPIKRHINVGDVFKTKRWDDVTVVKMEGYGKITVKFPSGCTKITAAKDLHRGSVKDDLPPPIYNNLMAYTVSITD